MTPTLTFTCSICSEPSVSICVYCTKDACPNHLCDRCGRCSDCCECDIRLEDHHEHDSHEHPVMHPVEAVTGMPLDGHGAPAAEPGPAEPGAEVPPEGEPLTTEPAATEQPESEPAAEAPPAAAGTAPPEASEPRDSGEPEP